MKNKQIPLKSLAILFSVLTAPLAFAADPLPGEWEITMESRVSGDPAFSPAPFTRTQCITAADADNPAGIVGPLSSSGVGGCTYTEKSYTNDTFRFSMNCAGGALDIKTHGSVSFSATRFDGNIIASINANGQTIEMRNRISGRRIGDC